MKKNNKGFFLPEAIVVISLITAVMAFVYPNLAKLYENYENRVKYYDQPEDLYVLKALYDSGKILITDCKSKTDLKASSDIDTSDVIDSGLEKIYIGNYTNRNVNDNVSYNFKRYLNRMKISTNDSSSCRIVGIFKGEDEESNEIYRYASIKVDNTSGKIENIDETTKYDDEDNEDDTNPPQDNQDSEGYESDTPEEDDENIIE